MSKAASPSRRILLLALGLLFSLLAGEVLARVWVTLRWPKERVELLTTHTSARGRFASHPNLPFALSTAWPGHNEFGFRGPSLSTAKPSDTHRVACVGASTTYGLYVEPHEAFPARLCAKLNATHGRWDFINAGVPGYVSTEILTTLMLRVLPLEPDVVVIMEGRNELFPQTYNHFTADYSHYRRAGFNYTVSNYAHKLVFRLSYLSMLACTVGGDRFGWSEAEEHPLYGGMIWENKPTTAQLVVNVQDPARAATWRRNLESMVAVCQARGIKVLVCTMAFRPDKLAVDELAVDDDMRLALVKQVETNNAIAREVCARTQATLVESSTLRDQPALFHDDCHVNAEGHRLRAEMVLSALQPLLDRAK